MEGEYRFFVGNAAYKGPMPNHRWNGLANRLRDAGRVREAGTFVGHLVAATGFTDPEMLRAAEANYAEAVQPPFSAADREAFKAGIEEVIAVNVAIGEII